MPGHDDIHEQLVALVNEAYDPELLHELLDPRGEFLRPWTTARILESRQSCREQKFTGIDQIRETLADEELFDQAVQSLNQAPSKNHPMLLLPLRLETRFQANKLIVRIYPDQVFVNTHEEALTEAEYQAIKKFCDAPDDQKREAWKLLSSQFGPPRAAWLKNWTKDHDVTVSPPFRSASWTQAPSLECLPDLFWVFAYRDGSLVDHLQPSNPVPTNPVRADSTILALPSSTVRLRLCGEPGTRIKAGTQVEHNPNRTVWTIAETVTIGADRKVDVSAKSGFLTPATRTTDWSIERGIAGWESVESLNDSASVDGLFDDRSRWMHDLPTAIQDGFAVEFTGLLQEDLTRGFDRLIAVGMKWTNASRGEELVEGMLDNHHYTSGIGFVDPGTPTNNAEIKSPYSSLEDHDKAYDIEVEGPSNWQAQSEEEEPQTNAYRLAQALGINRERLKHVEGAGSVGDFYARAMNTVIWQVTGDYYLRYLLPEALDDQHLDYIRTHVREFVRGGGPLPTLRIKRQPYGVLPVCRVESAENGEDGWAPWTGDALASPAQDRALFRVVSRLCRRWLDYARQARRVPRVRPQDEDPDETLLRILSMEPHSVGFHVQPFVDERFVAFLLVALRDYVFGSGTAYETLDLSPTEWIARWSDAWKRLQEDIAALLAGVTGAGPQGFLGQPLLKTLGWWEGEGDPIGMVHDPDDNSVRPIAYLSELCARGARAETGVETLLAKMGGRALLLAEKESAEKESAEKEDPEISDGVQSALCQLSSPSVLAFLNAAERPEQIVQRIEDDPKRRAFADIEPPHAYGVRLDLAQRILQRRHQLGGRFQSIGELDAIQGIGPDTFHDILYSFRDAEGQPDIDRLFRESLDLASHRVDAWVTSFATKRLAGIRAVANTQTGIHLGAYGFVENLEPRGEALSEGYIHMPSMDHAGAAAVLHNAFLTYGPQETSDGDEDEPTGNPYRINLTSDRVRKAMRILEGVRQGQPLGAILGYQFERALQDHHQPLEQYIDDFRERFPIVAHKVTPATAREPVEAVAARNVVDGVALVRDARREENTNDKVNGLLTGLRRDGLSEHVEALKTVIAAMDDTLDAYGDLLTTESIYQAVRGSFERSGAALEASHGNLASPELEFVTTPVPGRMFTHRVCLLFNDALEMASSGAGDCPRDPRGAAEPRVAAWFDSVLGHRGQIRIGFGFWEEEEDTNVLRRVNVNTASRRKLGRLPRIGKELADRIVEERCGERGLFKQIADLQRVDRIGEILVRKLRPLVTTGYVERVNVNTASRPELETLPVTPNVVDKIMEARDRKHFARIGDLARVIGIGHATVAELRPHVTTGLEEIGLDQLNLSAADFLYVAQATPEGGQTDLEQRVGRFVRDEFSLTAEQRIEVFPGGRGECEHSLDDAVDLAQQVLSLLAAGQPMSPDTMCHPGDIVEEGYTPDDVKALRTRVRLACDWVSSTWSRFEDIEATSRVRLRFEGAAGTPVASGLPVKHVPTGTIWAVVDDAKIGDDGTVDVMAETVEPGPPIVVTGASYWSFVIDDRIRPLSSLGQPITLDEPLTWERHKVEAPRTIGVPIVWGTFRLDSVQSVGNSTVKDRGEVVDLLQTAAKFGVHGTFPPAVDDPQLLRRFENVRAELARREARCNRLLFQPDATENPNSAIRQLVEAMKTLFGKSFICLPTFAPHNPDDLNQALAQEIEDLLNGLGQERLRSWMQQAAEVRPSLATLEDTLMLAEGWSQTTRSGDDPSLALKVAQLPFTPGRKWLGLSIEEGAEAEPDPSWARSPLSVVAAVDGEIPEFTVDPEDKNPVVAAGLVLDNWSELIPAGRVDTSVAFQYDAPSTQPPQTLLLAVPGEMEESSGMWTPQELVAIVNDTIDLAKVRAVDIDALAPDPDRQTDVPPEPVGGILPGIYLPVDPEQPGWARDVVMNTMDEWLKALIEEPGSPCADLAGFVAGESLGPKFESLGMQLISLGDDPPLTHGAGDSTVFPPEGIRLSWVPDARGELTITISQTSGLVPEPVPSVTAFDSGGNAVKSGFARCPIGTFREFRIDLERAIRVEIAGGYTEGVSHIYGVYSMCVRDPIPATDVVEGATFGDFVVRAIILQGAPSGDYTFHQDDPLVGVVHLLRNGTEVMQLSYDWQTTISYDDPCRFSFPGYFDIDIGKVGSGTRNLYGLKYNLFDGQQVLHVNSP